MSLSTGYFADDFTGRATKVHLGRREPVDGMIGEVRPLCGSPIREHMLWQWCASDVRLAYVECAHCKSAYNKLIAQARTEAGDPPVREEPRAFFFHYNKPASRNAGYPQISVHFKSACCIVSNVECEVPVKGRISSRQPHWVMAGRGVVRVVGTTMGNIARITAS